ncbi:hypothetical protein KFK09_024800 [Dendrobium nobile]|uniref:Reverse transcriptase Ty1/copia-type domain-containing protein n=1 Tax=Dendrobium nobile TaxID=94219 RepID=A0A8T3AET0_DENNO|nr:hypothetical protein KFK09_024800 [Dendrobium nobile]
MVTRLQTGTLKPRILLDLPHTVHPTPTCFSTANKDLNWRQAMSTEFCALQAQGTWSLVPLPSDQQVIGCKWIYKLKHHADGTIARYKARLVAQGFKQAYGIDYFETFSPDVKHTTNWLFLLVALHYDWSIHQLDVLKIQTSHIMCASCAKPSIYGIKQAPRLWFATLSNYLLAQQFTVSSADPSFFYLHQNGILVYILVYVDDILVNGSDQHYISSLIEKLAQRFQTRTLGSLSKFLGTEFYRTTDGYHLTQKSYITELLHAASMSNCKPLQTPLPSKYPTDPNLHLTLSAYFDSDWAGDHLDRKSTTGYCLLLGAALLAWSIKKQTTVARSSTEAEYRSMATAATDIIWTRRLCEDFLLPQQPTVLFCNNVSAMSIACNPIFHAQTKHIEIDHHFICDCIQANHIAVHHVSTVDQLADIFTKLLSSARMLELRNKLQVVPPFSLRYGVKTTMSTTPLTLCSSPEIQKLSPRHSAPLIA